MEININNVHHFSHARTALKYGLLHLKIEKGSSLLIPEYICDSIIQPIENLGLRYKYYPILDNLEPDWEKLEKSIDADDIAILMVHYFGQPQNIEKFRNLCEKNEIYLLEDNAHGYGGIYKNNYLGRFGDIGFSSPRKNLELDYGGVLFTKNKISIPIKLSKPPILSRMKKIVKKYFKSLVKYFHKKNKKNDIYEIKSVKEMLMDDKSFKVLNSINLVEVQKNRLDSYLKWKDFALKNNLEPVFKNIHNKATPWAFPAYASDLEEREKWIRWGKNNNVEIFSWPRLPKTIFANRSDSYKRWERLICFPLTSTKEIKL